MLISWLLDCQDPITRKEDGLQENTQEDNVQEDLQDGTNHQGNLFSKITTEIISQDLSHLSRKTFPQKNIHLHSLLGVIIKDHHQKREEMRADPIEDQEQIEVILPEDNRHHHPLPDTLPEAGHLAESQGHQAEMVTETTGGSLSHLDKEEDSKEVLQETDLEEDLQFLTIKTMKKLSIPNLLTKCFVTNVLAQATNLRIVLDILKVEWKIIAIIAYNMIENSIIRKNFVDSKRVFIGVLAIQKTIKGAK